MDRQTHDLACECGDPGVSESAPGSTAWRGSRAVQPPSRPGLLGSLDRYELLSCVGEGGMGIVFRARDPKSGETVAVKLLRPSLTGDRRAVAYFLKEGRHLQRLNHPHILPVLECSETADGAWLVMPLMEGGSLAGRIVAGQALETGTVFRVVRQVAEALAYAHRRSIIHRDVKPSNILFDDQGRVFLGDFGLAQSLWNDELVDVASRAPEGTAHYLSPGLARGDAEDTRGDIYAFGALLYEMLTGRPPYAGRDRGEVLKKIASGPPRAILQLNPKADRALAGIAEGAMARELKDRYAHVGYIVEDLERVESGRAPVGPREGLFRVVADNLAPRTVWRAVTRTPSRRLLSLGAAGALALAVAAFAAWRLAHPRAPSLRVVREIALPGILDWRAAKIGFWRSLEQPSFVVPDRKRVVYASADGLQVAELRLPERLEVGGLDLLHDFDGDGLSETVLGFILGRELRVSVFNPNLYETRRFTAQGHELTGEDPREVPSGMWAVAVADLEGDGKQELFAAVSSSYPPSPRGLLCFDYDTQALRWQHLTGPYVIAVQPFDLDGDGVQEVVAGTDAAFNKNTAPDGSDDSHSYVYAFKADGTVHWRVPLGDVFTQTRPLLADVEGDGRPKLFVCLTAAGDQREREKQPVVAAVVRLDREGKVTARRDFGASLWGATAADLDEDGREELLATDWEGNLHWLDGALNLVRSVNLLTNAYTRVELRIVGVADVDGAPGREIALIGSQHELATELRPAVRDQPPVMHTQHQNLIVVANARLEAVARYLVAPRWTDSPGFKVHLAQLGSSQRTALVLFTHKATVLELRR